MVSFVATAWVVTGVGATANAAPTWEEVAQSVTREKLSSVESVLDWFATNEATQLQNFTLMRRSGSIQKASPTNPRAIVYGEDARFIFTFNGHASQRGYDAIEVLQFRDRTHASPARWELREIRFGEKGVELSEADPGRCTQCHGIEPQPLWAQYDIWPGAYGEEDDAIRDFDEKYIRRGSDTDERVEEGRRELAGYRAFLAAKDEHPRYSKLAFPDGSPVTPYNTNVRSDYRFRTNLRFTDLITKLQAKVLADRIASRPEFLRVGPALTEALFGCTTEPEALDLAMKGIPLPTAFVSARWSTLNPDGPFQTAVIGALRRLALEPAQFSMTPDTDAYSYFEGQTYLSDAVAGELYDRLRPDDGSAVRFEDVLAERDAIYRGDYGPANEEDGPAEVSRPKERNACATLAKRRREALSVPVPVAKGRTPAVVQACLRCHDGRTAPGWAVDRPGFRAAVALRVTARPKGLAMPPDRALTPGEVDELTSYLESQAL